MNVERMQNWRATDSLKTIHPTFVSHVHLYFSNLMSPLEISRPLIWSQYRLGISSPWFHLISITFNLGVSQSNSPFFWWMYLERSISINNTFSGMCLWHLILIISGRELREVRHRIGHHRQQVFRWRPQNQVGKVSRQELGNRPRHQAGTPHWFL